MISAAIANSASSIPAAVLPKVALSNSGASETFQSLLAGATDGEESFSLQSNMSLPSGKVGASAKLSGGTAADASPAPASTLIVPSPSGISRAAATLPVTATPVIATPVVGTSVVKSPVEGAQENPKPAPVPTPSLKMLATDLAAALAEMPEPASAKSEAPPVVASSNPKASAKGAVSKNKPDQESTKTATAPLVTAVAAPVVLPLTLHLQLPVERSEPGGHSEDTPKVGGNDAISDKADSGTAPLQADTAFHARVSEIEPVADTVSFSGLVAAPEKAEVNSAPAKQASPTPAVKNAEPVARDSKTEPLATAPAATGSVTTPAAALPVAHIPAAQSSSVTTEPDPPASPVQARVAEPVEKHQSATQPVTTRPLREVTLHVASDLQKVDVQLTDHRGELRVVVKSGDPALTNDLRSGLDELVGGLEKSGFRAEAWRPEENAGHAQQPSSITARGATSVDQSEQQSGAQQQSGGDDPRQQGRNAYVADYIPRRRSSAAYTDWTNQIDALMRAEKEN